MLAGQVSRKAIAATLLLIFFTETFAPTLSYALTSGPTQPEATSFEPIDTTDMVNPQTGDFTYNIPLLEVPGPDGGYPLSLSYHADAQSDVDASWVGLGWTINPGAIDRSVNGYPDDWYEPTSTSHVYWAGGNTSTFASLLAFARKYFDKSREICLNIGEFGLGIGELRFVFDKKAMEGCLCLTARETDQTIIALYPLII